MTVDLQLYRKTSLNFRRVSSNMLRTTRNDELLYLIRFRDFIERNDIIQEILSDLWLSLPEGFNSGSLVSQDESGWYYFNIPINEAEHLKNSVDYLNRIIQEDMDLRSLSIYFPFTSSKKFDDKIREFLKKAFKPLVDFINDQISQKIMELEGVVQDMPQITQNIENNYGTASAIGSGNISTVNNTVVNELSNMDKLCEEIARQLKQLDGISDEEKEVIIDDIETIQSELKSENPKQIKLKKAWRSMQDFVKKLPVGLSVSMQILDLIDRISQMFQ